jgi:ribosome-binding factor A
MTGPMKSYPRADRVRAQMKQILAEEVEKLRDPGLGFVTITEVTLTPDLRHATVYYTVMGEESVHAATRDAMGRAKGHLRATVAQQIRLRYTPTIELTEDPAPEHTARIDELLAKLHREERG